MYLTVPSPSFHLFPSSSRPFTRVLSLPPRRPFRLAAIKRTEFRPAPNDEPPEVPEDTSHGLTRHQVFERQVDRARRRIEAENLEVPALDTSSSGTGSLKNPSLSPPADLYLDVDQAIYQKQPELVKAAAPAVQETQIEDELTSDEEEDLDEINDLQVVYIVSLFEKINCF
jgi:hypothetical protein